MIPRAQAWWRTFYCRDSGMFTVRHSSTWIGAGQWVCFHELVAVLSDVIVWELQSSEGRHSIFKTAHLHVDGACLLKFGWCETDLSKVKQHRVPFSQLLGCVEGAHCQHCHRCPWGSTQHRGTGWAAVWAVTATYGPTAVLAAAFYQSLSAIDRPPKTSWPPIPFLDTIWLAVIPTPSATPLSEHDGSSQGGNTRGWQR